MVPFRFCAVLARYVSAPSRLSWFLSLVFPLFPLSRSHTVSSCCPVPPRFAACAFPRVWVGMTGSDSEEAGHVARAELATFKQDMANEVTHLQAALQRTVDDIVDATCPHAPGGRGGASGLGP